MIENVATIAFDAARVVGTGLPGFGSTVGLWTTAPQLLAPVRAFMQQWINRVEATCSRFLPESDLSRVNANAGTAVKVAPEMVGAIVAARQMAALTEGLTDPTRAGGWAQIRIDRAESTVLVPKGLDLDLGASGKGWAVDMALEGLRDSVLRDNPRDGVCISAGGDLAVTGSPPPGGWPLTISETLDAGGPNDEELRLHRGAVASSGTATRGHHIIDPRTGGPGQSRWALVTVFSDSCLVSDAVATASWLKDGDAPDWVDSLGLAARLLDQDGSVTWIGPVGRWTTG